MKLQEYSRENISLLSQSWAKIDETQGADVLSIDNINFNMFQFVQSDFQTSFRFDQLPVKLLNYSNRDLKSCLDVPGEFKKKI